MPICTRNGFYNVASKDNRETFHDYDKVFLCEITKEIFSDYDDYFRHIMAINSTVWQCEATGKENLTYAEALKSERMARKKMAMFKNPLRAPVMLVIDHAKQSSLNILSALTFRFLRRRFFLNEEVLINQRPLPSNAQLSNIPISGLSNIPYIVVGVVPPLKIPAGDVYENTEEIQYRLRGIGKYQDNDIVVPYNLLRRQRTACTAENVQMFIKNNVIRIDGILRPNPDSYKQYVTNHNITFESIFIGKIPYFTPAKSRKPIDNDHTVKKQSTLNKYLIKNDVQPIDEKMLRKSEKDIMTNKNKNREINHKEHYKEKEEKGKSFKEEMERLRQERQKQLLAQEQEKVEKRAKLMEKIEEECTALLTKTDDLERSDQRLLPLYTPVLPYMSKNLLSDAFMLKEFLQTFASLLSGIEVFKNSVSYYELTRAFSIREVAGPLSDIVLILLGTIFDLQREEEEECAVEYVRGTQSLNGEKEPIISMTLAAKAHHYTKRHFSVKLNELPLDALTVSEVLRLHLLSSGAVLKNRKADKWRIMYRNGYTSLEDPGLAFRMQYPHILQILRSYTIYQLPFKDITRIINCLMNQILTYSATITLIEERLEQMSNIRQELRNLISVENQRLAKVHIQKRAITNEFHQQCIDIEVKKDPGKRKVIEDKFNKRLTELTTHSDREHKKFEQQVTKIHASIFQYMIYLGMDRAYRKYYIWESLPGIFIEHPRQTFDTCLTHPPKNSPHIGNTVNVADLPRTRKELRAYLLRKHNEDDIKNAKSCFNKNKNSLMKDLNNKENMEESDNRINMKEVFPNKENKENQMNGVINNFVNGFTNQEETSELTNSSSLQLSTTKQSTQYELFMCSGDPHNCIVHDENNTDRQQWSYLHRIEDLEALINSLNSLGIRESELREQLITYKPFLEKHIEKCPVEMLTVEVKQMSKFKSLMMSDTHRKYNNANFGFPEKIDVSEVMYGTLVNRILQFEQEIYTGDLGRLKVKDMVKWRLDLQEGHYDPQVKLQWGPPKEEIKTEELMEYNRDHGQSHGNESDNDAEVTEHDDGIQYAGKPFRDPGESLGDTLQMDAENNMDEKNTFLKESDTLRTYVKHLASALLQVEQAVERRFLKEPFGVPLIKDKEAQERKHQQAISRLRQWEISLMECSSYSQIFLHLNVFNDCIIWARSTNKSNCMVCRRGSDPDKMLLCDECNRGTHMFCMKPKMRSVPEGNWYCKRCVTHLGLQNKSDEKNTKAAEKRKRAFILDESNSDASITSESITSESKLRRGAVRLTNLGTVTTRRSRRLHSREIDMVLTEIDENEEDNQDVENAEDSEALQNVENEINDDNVDDDEIQIEYLEESEENSGGDNDVEREKIEVFEKEIDSNSDAEVNNESDSDDNGSINKSEEANEDENICQVCSYDGCELSCIRCKDSFHLECINLKRPPRYNFHCNKCKSKEVVRKRKLKTYAEGSDTEGSDDVQQDIYSNAKRTRSSRLRNAQGNVNIKTSTNDSIKESTKQSIRRSNRRLGDNLPLNNAVLLELLERIMKHESAWPFVRPVSQSEVPDYYKIIKKPMDFAKIKSKLNMGAYSENADVMRDIELIFNNCDEYNLAGDRIYKEGAALEKYVIGLCKNLQLIFKPSDMNTEN